MNDWEVECADKKYKLTPEYCQKLRINLHYEKPGENNKIIKIEESKINSRNSMMY